MASARLPEAGTPIHSLPFSLITPQRLGMTKTDNSMPFWDIRSGNLAHGLAGRVLSSQQATANVQLCKVIGLRAFALYAPPGYTGMNRRTLFLGITMRPADTDFFRYFTAGQRDRQWGLWVSGLGATEIAPSWTDYPKRIHPDAYMFRWEQGRVLHEHTALYVLRGEGEFESAAAGRRQVAPGTLILLFPADWHRYRPDKKTGWDEYWVSFAGRQMDELVRGGFFSPAEPLMDVGPDETVLRCYLDLLDLGRAEPLGFQQLAAAGVYSILAAALTASRRRGSSEKDEQRVREAKVYLEEHVEASVSIPDLAKALCISPRHLSRLFRRHMGMSPHEFYVQLKMRRVQQLLGTDLSLKEIAHRLGFESPFHLSRAFKNRFGEPPSQWRQGR